MDSLIIVVLLTASPHWPLVAFLAACGMGLLDLACAGWVGLYVAVRAWDGIAPVKRRVV